MNSVNNFMMLGCVDIFHAAFRGHYLTQYWHKSFLLLIYFTLFHRKDMRLSCFRVASFASFAAHFLSYLISQETFKRMCTRKIITYFICTYLLTSNTHELWLITLHHQNKSFAKVLNTVWTELKIIHTTTSIVSYNESQRL